MVCRELLKAESVIAGKIKDRVQGDYGKEYTRHQVTTGPVATNGNGEVSSPAASQNPEVKLSACIPATSSTTSIEHPALSKRSGTC